MGCSSIPRITMLDVATPVSEQSRIWLKSNSDASIISVDGDFAWTKSSQGLIDPNTYEMDKKTDAFLYFPSGRRTITINWKTRFTDWGNYNSYTNTRTEVTLSGNYLQFTDDFLPEHTYTFEVMEFNGNYILVLVDVPYQLFGNKEGNWITPKIAPNAPESGKVTNWDYPVNAPYFDPSLALGTDFGFSKIKRLVESEAYIGGIADFGDADFYGQLFLNGGIGLGWENWGLGVISEIGGGFGSFYMTQWHYTFMIDAYFDKWNIDLGWGNFQGSGAGFEDITSVPSPFLRGIVIYKLPNGFKIGGYFDYYYENDSIGFGFRWLGDMKGFPLFVRKALN